MKFEQPFRNRIARSIALVLFLATFAFSSLWGADTPSGQQDYKPILSYISSAWDTLTRSMSTCSSIVDPKIAQASVLYVPQGFAQPDALRVLQNQCQVKVESLPFAVKPGMNQSRIIDNPGLLYLPNSYVVPGGRFNEMYGWDSYFIVVGLLRDGRIDLAKGMVDNFLFEIEHYGTVLNANRTYFLTRSQPPFLTTMILDVYNAQKAAGHDDRDWLKNAYSFAAKDYEMWIREPHLAGSTGLSRYYDFGEGPVPEGLQDETGFYRSVTTYFLSHPENADHDLIEFKSGDKPSDVVGFPFSLQVCESTASGQKCDPSETIFLSRDYYKGDRSMRESGFDVSFRFGPFGAHTHDFAPVCLNSLLYKTETDLQKIATMLGQAADAQKWHERSENRKAQVNKYLWDAKRGLFFDFNFVTGKQSTYPYITTFYPLWAGLASPDQARDVEKNLPQFEQLGGLLMSRNDTGAQWDYPYGWAPTQFLGIEGLRRYHFDEDADRLSNKFLSMVNANFQRDGTIHEKYNVVTASSETHITAGYNINVVGFGWTNGVFLELLHDLSIRGQGAGQGITP